MKMLRHWLPLVEGPFLQLVSMEKGGGGSNNWKSFRESVNIVYKRLCFLLVLRRSIVRHLIEFRLAGPTLARFQPLID